MAGAILVRALDHLNGLSLASRMIGAHDPLHPKPLRGVNHNVEKPCPAAQQVECAAAENHAGHLNRQFGNEAALDLRQLFIGGPARRRWGVDVVRGSTLKTEISSSPKLCGLPSRPSISASSTPSSFAARCRIWRSRKA